MRRIGSISSALFLVLQACAPKGGGGSTSSDQPQNQDPGQVKVDTAPTEEQVDDSQKVTDNPVDLTTAKVQMTGTIAVSTGLTTVAAPDKILAFPVQGGRLKSIKEVLSADIAADGTFKLALPQFDPRLAAMKAVFGAGGILDREKLKAYLQKFEQNANAAEILARSDKDLKAEVDKLLRAADEQSFTYALISMVSSDKTNPLEKRAEEAASFAFVGLSAGGKNLFNIPVGNAKKDIAMGKITIDGDNATSSVDAGSGLFDLPTKLLEQIAATGGTLKAIRNDYVNIDPTTGEFFQASPFFLFYGNVAEADDQDQFTTTEIGYRRKVPSPNAGYSGYSVFMRGVKSPLKAQDVCGPTRKLFELQPPAAVTTSVSSGHTNPMTNDSTSGHAWTPVGSGDSMSYECIGDSEDLWYSSARKLTDPEMSWDWGSGGSLEGDVPAGIWDFQITGADVAQFDLSSARPLQPANSDDDVANVFVPQIRVLRTPITGIITAVQVKFSYYNGGFKAMDDVAALRRGVKDLAVEFDDYTGCVAAGGAGRVGNRMKLVDFNADGVYSTLAAAGESEFKQFKFPAAGYQPTDCVAESISVTYQMYGNSYRFDFRRH